MVVGGVCKNFGKIAFLKKILTFWPKKKIIFETSLDFHKSEEKFSTMLTPPPLKIYLNPNPPPRFLGRLMCG
jgi:hypothetical protein